MVKAKGRAKSAPSKSPPEDKPSKLYVNTTLSRRQQFHAACQLKGASIQDVINQYMIKTIEEAGIRPTQTA